MKTKTMQVSSEDRRLHDLTAYILRLGNYDPNAPISPENKRYERRIRANTLRILRTCKA